MLATGPVLTRLPLNSRFYRATRFLLIRARISFCCLDARFITFE
jgi:hypothetical protein